MSAAVTKKTGDAVRLMIIDDSVEDAEGIVSTLRNGGIAVRPLRPQNTDDLNHMVNTQPIDLALVSKSLQFPLATVARVVDASGKDIPLIALAETVDDNVIMDVLKSGARAIALKWQPEQLFSILQRERTDLEARRQLRRLEVMLRETERRCDALISSSRDPIAYIHDGMHVRANEAYLAMFGFESFEDVEGLPFLDLVAPQDVERFKQLLKTLAQGEMPQDEYHLHLRQEDGTIFLAKLEFAAANYEGESSLQLVIRQQQEEVDPELAREVEALRLRDSVTGLLNRSTFLRVLEDVVGKVGKGEGGNFGFLLIEADHYFQMLNKIGLDSADAFIAALAQRLTEATGEGMQVARFGEQSLAVLFAGKYAQTMTAAERIREAFSAKLVEVGTHSTSITVSIGGVQIGEKIANLNSVLKHATEKLQAAKDIGGNSIDIYDPGARDRLEEENIQRWLKRIRDALSGEGFVLHFQPVISLLGEPYDFYEVHLRMNVNGEIVKPGAFIEIAEEHGLLELIDLWVARSTIAAIGARMRSGKNTRLLMKVNPSSFDHPNLLQLIHHELKEQGVAGDLLWLQVTESKVFTHLGAAQRFAEILAPFGCKLGLEQFGSGLDSFQLLNHIQPAFIKLDHVLTKDLSTSAETQEKVSALTTQAHEENMQVIADHVADASTMAQLFSSGIDYAEGEFIGLPNATMDFDFQA